MVKNVQKQNYEFSEKMIQKNINNAKEELLAEMKTLCKEIENTQSFLGVVSLESRIHKIYQNFIILKYLDAQPTISETVEKPNLPEVEAYLEEQTTKKLNEKNNFPKLALSLNDKIAFKNQLFNKEEELFEKVIDKLNVSNSFLEAKSVLKEYALQFDWEAKNDFAQRFEKVIEKRFS